MKYYRTINYPYNLWKSDGLNWWYWNIHCKAWVYWGLGPIPTYDAFSVTYDSKRRVIPKEISEAEAFIELL